MNQQVLLVVLARWLLILAYLLCGVNCSCSTSTDKFTSLTPWTLTNGWAWGESYFSSSSSSPSTTGLTLTMATSGCPSGCGGVSMRSGGVSSKTSYQYGTINITAKTSPYGNFMFSWESSSPTRDGIEFEISGSDLAVAGYINGQYTWYGGYPLQFSPSAAFHTYTLSRTSSSILLFVDSQLRVTISVTPLPTSSGLFSMMLQGDTTIPVPSTSVIVQSFSYSSSGCPVGGAGSGSQYDGVHIPAAPTGPAPPSIGWKVVAADSFNQKTLSSLWASGLIFGQNTSEGANGPASGAYMETQWFQPQNLILGDGNLRLRVKQETVTKTINSKSYSFPYTSGAIRGWPGGWPGGFGFNFFSARTVIEWRAQMPPAGPGSWPALWFCAINGVWPPEIDQMEMFGSSTNPSSHLHLTFNGQDIGPSFADTSGTDYSKAFHIWTIDMQATGIYVYIDGMLQGSITDSSYLSAIQNDNLAMNNHFWYAIANVAVQNGETPVGLPFDMAIDYFVAYQPSNSPSSAIQGGGLAPNTSVAVTSTTTSRSTTSSTTTSGGSTTGSSCVTVDKFASIDSSRWTITNGWGWGASYFTSSQVSTNSNGLLLSMTKTGCPSACGGSALQAGRISSITALSIGTYQIVMKAETYANFQIGWESSNPRDGVELTITGKLLTVQYYSAGTYHWVNQYTLPFTPSAGFYKYTMSRTSSQVTVYANGAQVTSFNTNVPQSPGMLSMALQSDSTIAVTSTSASVSSVGYYPAGCSFTY